MAREHAEAQTSDITLFGMSGLGKTHVAKILRFEAGWFHYNIDYRIATRYMGAFIEDDLKRQAMALPAFRALLMSDSITIRSKVSFDNLAPLSAYLGKPGDAEKGGLGIDEYLLRQKQHHEAEARALLDMGHFQSRAGRLYGHRHFICDTGGSICEIVNPHDPSDPILTHLRERSTLVWIKGGEAHIDMLIERFNKAPKPMCYPLEYVQSKWHEYLETHDIEAQKVNPDHFVRWIYADAIKARQPKYQAMADHWGVSVEADALKSCASSEAILELIQEAKTRPAARL